VYNSRLLSTGPIGKFERFGVTQQGGLPPFNPTPPSGGTQTKFIVEAMAIASAGK
jgi:hypothetical protein